MEFDAKTLAAIGAALYAIYMLFKDYLPKLSTIKGMVFSSDTKKEDKSKLSILQTLWEVRSNFEPTDKVYKNITDAIENLVHYKEVMGEDNE